MAFRDYLIGEVAEEYTEGLLSRRDALRRLVLLGLAVPSASALLAACGGDDGAQAEEDPDDADNSENSGDSGDSGDSGTESESPSPMGPSLGPDAGEMIHFEADGAELMAAFKAPEHDPKGAILVVHENKGLQPHFYDLVGRFAKEGYAALCVDLLSRAGGTASLKDSVAEAPGKLAAASPKQLVADLNAGLDELEKRAPDAKLGAVGFCFGGGMIWSLLNTGAKAKRLAATASFYGPPPEDLHFTGAKAAVLVVYAGKDDRVNSSRPAIESALKKAGLSYEIKVYEGADHAFFNDTGERYDAAAAKQANTKLLGFFGKHLA